MKHFLILWFITVTVHGNVFAQTANWMSQLDDKQPLARLNIPGTHDTCALFGILNWGQCQTLTLQQQLKLGVRFLDIR